MNGAIAYALSKQYVASTADSLGSLKGAPCTIKSQTETDDSYIVTFEWTGTSGAKETSQLTIKKPKDGIDGLPGKDGKDGLNGKDGSDGIGISKIEKIRTVDLVDIYRITFTDSSTFDYEVKNGKDGQGSGTADVPIEKIKVNGELQTPVNKVVDITVPDAYDDTDIRAELAKKADTDHTHTTVNGHTVESDVPVDAKFTDTVYDDTQVKTQIQAVANGLMDSVGYSADYKSIDIIAKNGVKKSVDVAPIISHASITELSDVDTTNKATGKALVYNATISKHEYADVSGTDEKVKMDASTDAKYLGELLDNITIANENGELKVKKLDGQEVTITEINYLKGLTMNVMDLVNMFSNGGVKIINTPVATYAELLTLDKSSFIEGISYLVYVLADENHDNAKTTYLVDKDSETPTYFGFADSQRDFTTNPIDLATEITGKLGIANMDSDAIKALFTVDDTYKTETATNNAFSTHGAKALYDELLLAIGNKANNSDLTSHKDDTDIHVSTEDRTKWDSAKTHADSAHAPSNAQENVLETVKVNGAALEVSNKAVNVTVPTTVSELTDSDDYAKTADVNDSIKALQTDKANTSDLTAHTGDSVIHVTAENKTLWDTVSNKVNKEDGKALLADTDKTNYDDAVTKAHTHENKEVLDSITSDKVTYWDNKSEFSGSYNDLNDKPTIDAELSNTSENAIQNKVVTKEINKLYSDISFNDFDTATDGISFTDAEDGNMIVTDCTRNLLNPTLQTTTRNGVTCTNNGDGTYTLNGTCTEETNIGKICIIGKSFPMDLRFLGVPNGCNSYLAIGIEGESNKTINNGRSVLIQANKKIAQVDFWINQGDTFDNVVFKPMLTTDLSATYDDFVPYGGYEIQSCGKNLLDPNDYIDGRNIKNDFDTLYSVNTNTDGRTWIYGNSNYYFKAKTQNMTLIIDVVESFNEGGFRVFSEDGIMIYDKIGGELLNTGIHKFVLNVEPEKMYGIMLKLYSGKVKISLYNSDETEYEPYTGETIKVTNDTEYPAFGLKSHKGITNIISPGNVKCVYPTNESGKGVLDSLYNKDKMLTELEVLGKCKNLLNPTLQTTVQNGVTCTNNGDGTYTLNGTNNADDSIWFELTDFFTLEPNKKYKLVGGYPNSNRPFENANALWFLELYKPNNTGSLFYARDFGDGIVFTATETTVAAEIGVRKGATLNNFTFKPMLTENLNATYDDFVPYTGDGDTLTHDVAELKNDLGGLTFSASGTTLSITDGTHTWTLEANS